MTNIALSNSVRISCVVSLPLTPGWRAPKIRMARLSEDRCCEKWTTACSALTYCENRDGIHKTPLIGNWFAKRRRFHVHFTPTYASWLSLVERWFALLTTQLRRGVFRSVPQLKAAIQAFINAHQENPKPFVWTTTADEILASIARFAERTADARGTTSVTNHRDRTLGQLQDRRGAAPKQP